LIRFCPFPKDGKFSIDRHSQFAETMTRVIREANPNDLTGVLWAIYFWFQQNWKSDDFWDGLSKKFVKSLSNLLSSHDHNILRFALYANSYLWLMPMRNRRGFDEEKMERKAVLHAMKVNFPFDVMLRLIQLENADVSALAFLLLTNFVAFDRWTFEIAVERAEELMAISLEVIENSAMKVKCEAIHFVCVFLQLHSQAQLAGRRVVELLPVLIDGLELEDPELSDEIVSLLIRLVREGPELIVYLLDADFDQYLEAAKESVGSRGDALCLILEKERNSFPYP
jgi:hypothetical protein